jgi:hypothetical protein
MKKILVMIVVVVAALNYFQKETPRSTEVREELVSEAIDPEPYKPIPAPKPVARFSCDGRQYCSQMSSRAEAEFFVRHCPNVKMDGDRDGIPCENDSRF